MASNSYASYIAPDGTIFKFTMIFNCGEDMDGVVIPPEMDIEHPHFVKVLKAAQLHYTYFAPIQSILERYEPTAEMLTTIVDGVKNGVYEFSQYWSSSAAGILNGTLPEPYPSYASDRNKPKKKPGYVYLIRGDTNPTTYKIGYTKDIASRSKAFGLKLPFDVEFEHIIETDDMTGLESELHQRYSEKRINGEWFDLTPEDVAYIKSLGVQNG